MTGNRKRRGRLRRKRGEPPAWFRWTVWLGMAASVGLAAAIAGLE